MGDFASAVADYTRVAALDPGNSHAYHNRGISHDKLGNWDAAIADFSRVLELDPVCSAACPVHPLCARCIGLTRAVCGTMQSNANAYFNRGSTYDSSGMYDKAIADYTKALELDRQIISSAAAGAAAAAGGDGSAGSAGRARPALAAVLGGRTMAEA